MNLFQCSQPALDNPAVRCCNQTVTAYVNYVGNTVVMVCQRPYIYIGYDFVVLDT
jgi:hypothetical protein